MESRPPVPQEVLTQAEEVAKMQQTQAQVEQQAQPEVKAETEKQGFFERVWNKIESGIRRLTGKEVVTTPDSKDIVHPNHARLLKREYVEEGLESAQKIVAARLAQKRVAQEVAKSEVAGWQQDLKNRAEASEPQLDLDALGQNVKAKLDADPDFQKMTDAEKTDTFNKTMALAVKNETARREERVLTKIEGQLVTLSQTNSELAKSLKPTGEDLKEAKNIVPDFGRYRSGLTAGEATRDPLRIEATITAQKESEKAAKRSKWEKARKEDEKNIEKQPQDVKEKAAIEATRELAAKQLERARRGDYENMQLDVIERDWKVSGEKGRTKLLEAYFQQFFPADKDRRMFEKGKFAVAVDKLMEYNNKGDKADRAKALETAISKVANMNLGQREATEQNQQDLVAILYMGSGILQTGKGRYNGKKDFAMAESLGYMYGKLSQAENFDQLLGNLKAEGLITPRTEALLQQYYSSEATKTFLNERVGVVNKSLNQQIADNPAISMLLPEMLNYGRKHDGKMREKDFAHFAAMDYLSDLVYPGNKLAFIDGPKGSRLLTVDSPYYMYGAGTGMEDWLNTRFANNNNKEFDKLWRVKVLDQLHPESQIDEMPLQPNDFITKERGLKETPEAYREMTEQSPEGQKIATLMRELGLTREQAVNIINTSEKNFLKEMFSSSKTAASAVVRGLSIAVGMGVGLAAVNAWNPAVATAIGVGLAIYGAYSTLKGVARFFKTFAENGKTARTGMAEFIDWNSEKEWGKESNLDRNLGGMGRVKRTGVLAGRFLKHLFPEDIVWATGGLATGGAAAWFFGPVSGLFTPVAALAFKGIEAADLSGKRKPIMEVMNRLKENPGENMTQILNDIVNTKGVTTDEARELLRTQLLGSQLKYAKRQNNWEGYITGLTLGIGIGSLTMKVTRATTGLEMVQDKLNLIKGGDLKGAEKDNLRKGDSAEGEIDKKMGEGKRDLRKGGGEEPETPPGPETPPPGPGPETPPPAGGPGAGWFRFYDDGRYNFLGYRGGADVTMEVPRAGAEGLMYQTFPDGTMGTAAAQEVAAQYVAQHIPVPAQYLGSDGLVNPALLPTSVREAVSTAWSLAFTAARDGRAVDTERLARLVNYYSDGEVTFQP